MSVEKAGESEDTGEVRELHLRELGPALSKTLQRMTPARIGLGRSGTSLRTREVLDFQLAHARARDAVHASLDVASLKASLKALGSGLDTLIDGTNSEINVILMHSDAEDRREYLQRPDKGRKLNKPSRQFLEELRARQVDDGIGSKAGYDLALVIADGLSALAVERHTTPLLSALLPALRLSSPRLRLAPIAIVEQGRVAIGDEIALALAARMVIVLIGERPGLSSPDSLGIYITWLGQVPLGQVSPREVSQGQVGNRRGRITDAERNCISNIRLEGLSYEQAAARLLFYIQQASALQLTGVSLKDPETLRNARHSELAAAEETKE